MRLFHVLPFAVTLVACSSNDTTPQPVTDAGPADSLPPDASPVDAAIPYPAPHPPMPLAVAGKGPVIKNPKFLPITFAGDPLQKDIDAFMVAMGAAKEYWAGTTAEYGVGPATTLAPIHSTDVVPSSMTDLDIQAWLTAKIADKTLPAPDTDTIYTLFYSITSISLGGGVGCQDYNGYHNDFQLQNGKYVIYAVMPRCPPPVMSDTLTDMMAAIASHELVEAATDPLPQDSPAYQTMDADHAAWSLVTGGTETGDLCAPFPGVFSRTMPNMPFLVQRTWSNAAGAASHDPCAPLGVDPYFNSAPVLTDSIQFTTGANTKATTRGVKIPVGQSGTVELDLYSDAPTSGPWTVSALDFEDAFKGTGPYLKFAFDRTTGQNGDKLQLTISVKKKGSAGAEPFWIINKLGKQTTVWVGVVGN